MNKKNVLTYTGGGGGSLNRFYNGRDIIIPHNYRRSCSDNASVAHWQY